MEKRERKKVLVKPPDPKKFHPVEKQGRIVVERNPEKKEEKLDVREWIIYLWLDEQIGVYYAAARALNLTWGYGWKIEKDINKPTDNRAYWQARRNAVIRVDNTLNVLNMYGKKVINESGEIDWEKVKERERVHSWFGILQKTRKFPIVEITAKQAFNYKLV